MVFALMLHVTKFMTVSKRLYVEPDERLLRGPGMFLYHTWN